VPAARQPGADTNSPGPEVDAAAELILQHVRERPEESLGVITMGIRHQDRIEERLRQRLGDDPELAEQLAEFLDENREEEFWVGEGDGLTDLRLDTVTWANVCATPKCARIWHG
jgi:hypothetical protein